MSRPYTLDKTSTPYLVLLNCSRETYKVRNNAVVAFHLQMDHLFSEAPTREKNAAGYLIRFHEGTPQSEPGGESERGVDVYQNTSTYRRASRLDLVRIGRFFVPPNDDLVAGFVLLHKHFFWAAILEGSSLGGRTQVDRRRFRLSPRQLRG